MKAVLILLAISLSLGCCCVFPDSRKAQEPQPPKSEMDGYMDQWSRQKDVPPESLAEEENRKRRERMPEISAWDGLAKPVADWMRISLHDYGSAKVVQVSNVQEVSPGVFVQRVQFRAKNRMGAYVLEDMIFTMSKTTVIETRPAGR